MSPVRVFTLTTVAMTAFAGNSVLCRLALTSTPIDAASFTGLRIIAGAVALFGFARLHGKAAPVGGSWWSAIALFAYAAGFSFAYVSLTTATGALLLFGAVQATMIGHGVWMGERVRGRQVLGLVLAGGGVVGLLLPGLAAPPLGGGTLMLGAGVAWGVYSLRGQGEANPGGTTAGNFLRAVPFAVVLSLFMAPWMVFDEAGVWYAVMSGALTSGAGYVIWYMALGGLTATTAAAVQLSVPVLAAVGGVLLLDEAVTLRLVLASAAILGGIAMIIATRQTASAMGRG